MIIVARLGGLVSARTFGAFVAFLFLGAAFLAIGTMASAITENQVIASLLSLTIIFFAQYISVVASQLRSIMISLLNALTSFGLGSESINSVGQGVENAVNWFDPYTRLDSLYVGIFSFSPLIYCASLVLIFLFITYRILEKRRWSQS
jgi:ABC-2 type transport system permease protein